MDKNFKVTNAGDILRIETGLMKAEDKNYTMGRKFYE
jgi:hypothetical protein